MQTKRQRQRFGALGAAAAMSMGVIGCAPPAPSAPAIESFRIVGARKEAPATVAIAWSITGSLRGSSCAVDTDGDGNAERTFAPCPGSRRVWATWGEGQHDTRIDVTLADGSHLVASAQREILAQQDPSFDIDVVLDPSTPPQFRGAFVSIDVLLTWGTQRFTHVTVRHDPRTIGTSNYTLRKLITHAVNMMTGFSTIPLQLASWIGFLLTGFGIAIFCYVVAVTVIEGGSPPGFPFLACLIAVFSGAQLLCLGIIGEYLGRAHFRLLDRPPYQVRTAVRGGGAATSDGA